MYTNSRMKFDIKCVCVGEFVYVCTYNMYVVNLPEGAFAFEL